jgi:hypothetical protein
MVEFLRREWNERQVIYRQGKVFIRGYMYTRERKHIPHYSGLFAACLRQQNPYVALLHSGYHFLDRQQKSSF